MPIDTTSRSKAYALLHAHWKPETIAEKIHCHKSTVFRWEQRIQMYGTLNPPTRLRTGRPHRVHTAAREGLLEYLRQYPWVYQNELVIYLAEEWSITVNRTTISRLLKEHRISHKRGQRVGHTQSQQLRTAWQAFMLDVTAEQLVFLDESIFKQQSCWRAMAYGPIGQPARYSDDMRRGDTWSILPAYTIDGYLPCTGVRQGFFNADAFSSWISNELLPHCNAYPGPRSIICLDNLNVHLDQRVRRALEENGLLIRFLPPYSPDFSPIELTFGLLKAWMRRHFRDLRALYEGDFGGFIRHAIATSQCDQKGKKHFRHEGYQFEGDYAAFQRELDAFATADMY